MRWSVTLAAVAAIAVATGCARSHKPAAPPAAQDNALVVIIDGTPLRVMPSTRVPEPPTPSAASPAVEPQATVVEDAAPLGLPAARPLRPVKLVVIDPGHGGENTGATQGAVIEKEVNLDASLKLAASLRRRGFSVVLTRTTDVFLTLEERAVMANQIGADLFICMHANAAANPLASGIEVYYPTDVFHQNGRVIDDVARAQDIGTRELPDGPFTWDGDLGALVTPETLALNRDLGHALGLQIERAMTRDIETTSRGVKPAGYEVLRWAACPAVLVEIGFLTNDADCEKLADPSYRERVAKAIAEAVSAYAAPAGERQ
jgi:N-acetylmuramoyl-L-alanine amidase